MIGSFRLPISLTSSGDTTAPTILSAKVEDANPNKLVVVFSELVTITNTTGLTITGDATPTLSAPTGSGTNTITFTLSTALTNGQSVTLNVAANNTIKDAANNALAATTIAITNNVAAAGYDVDYQAVLDYATANSIALPSTVESGINNQIVIDLKANGAWAKLDMFLKYKGDANSAFKLICWKRVTAVVAYGSLTWSATGVQGNGSNTYIDPLINLSTLTNYKLNDAGIYYIPLTDIKETTASLGVKDVGNNQTAVLPGITNNASYLRMNNISDDQSEKIGDHVTINTLNGMDRTVSTEFTWRHGTSTVLRTSPSSAVPNAKFIIMASNTFNGTSDSMSLFSSNAYSYFFLGSSMDTNFAGLKTILE